MTRTDERQAMDALLSMDSPFTAAEFAEQLNREQRKDDDPQFVHVDATKADRVLDLMLSRGAPLTVNERGEYELTGYRGTDHYP